MIKVDNKDRVSVITLDRGITNALNLELLQELGNTIKKLESDPKTQGLVLCSSNDKFFSIGFDIPQLFELSKKDFRFFYHTFNQVCLDLYTLSLPTVASITGHAVAGGCILALCCDYRLMAAGRKLMGLNEIKLGVPVPYLIDLILRSLVGGRNSRDIMETGEFYPPEKLVQLGMIDQTLPLEEVQKSSMEKARLLGSFPEGAFEAIKRNRVETIEAQFLMHRKEKEDLFLKCWFAEDTRKRLKEAMEKF